MSLSILLVGAASAAQLTGTLWSEQAFPIEVAISGCPTDLGETGCTDALASAMARLSVSECTGISLLDTSDAPAGAQDTGIEIAFAADLTDDATTLVFSGGETIETPHGVFDTVGSVDILLSEEVAWGTESQLVDDCQERTSLEGILVQELALALGISWDADEASALRPLGVCEAAQPVTDADIEALEVAYEPQASFECVPNLVGEVVGSIPLLVTCALNASPGLNPDTASWRFGDGGTAVGEAVSHAYTTKGNFTVSVGFEGQCVTETNERITRYGYVRACDVPDVAFGIFHHGGLKYTLDNETDVTVYGCLDQMTWSVYSGSKSRGEPLLGPISTWEPTIELPSEGTYTIVAEATGLAGAGAARATLDATGGLGDGLMPITCSTACNTGGNSGAWWPVACVGWLLLRRRRDA